MPRLDIPELIEKIEEMYGPLIVICLADEGGTCIGAGRTFEQAIAELGINLGGADFLDKEP